MSFFSFEDAAGNGRDEPSVYHDLTWMRTELWWETERTTSCGVDLQSIIVYNFRMLRMDDLGSALRVARLQHGWSQADVAQRIGVAQSHVAKIEAGSDARFSTIRRMAAAFGLDIVLMQSDGSPQSDSDRAFESARAFGVDIASLKLSLQMSPSERFHAAVRAATNLATLRR